MKSKAPIIDCFIDFKGVKHAGISFNKNFLFKIEQKQPDITKLNITKIGKSSISKKMELEINKNNKVYYIIDNIYHLHNISKNQVFLINSNQYKYYFDNIEEFRDNKSLLKNQETAKIHIFKLINADCAISMNYKNKLIVQEHISIGKILENIIENSKESKYLPNNDSLRVTWNYFKELKELNKNNTLNKNFIKNNEIIEPILNKNTIINDITNSEDSQQ